MNTLSPILYDALWLIIPCGLINISLNLFYEAKRNYGVKHWDRPFDCGLHLGKHRLLGESTTWGGLVVSFGVGALLSALFPFIPAFMPAFGAFFGHALGSFIKRRLGLPRGSYLPIVDHGDYIIFTGALYLTARLISPAAYLVAIAVILSIHPIFCIVAYKLGLRDNMF